MLKVRLPRAWRWVLAWLLLTLLAATALVWTLLDPQPSGLRAWFTPGPMTHGHHSIELACGACHTDPFGGGAVLQASCVGCHGEQLKLAEDTHPRSKFTDPRNADLVKKLDGRACVSCHAEHRPGITGAMGLSLPPDYCVTCHLKVGKERPSHAGLGFDTCASAGCHNYHDNRALHADFLLAHAQEPALLASRVLPARDFAWRWKAENPRSPATVPDLAGVQARLAEEWRASSHAQAGVQCGACHAADHSAWTDKPPPGACKACHANQVQGFLAGKHGMTIAAGLPPMRPEQSRLPMRQDAGHRQLGCGSCHAAHRFDTRTAAVDACLACHADRHSLAYRESKHFRLWQAEQAGTMPPGSGVSCASCHLPRLQAQQVGIAGVEVEHNQNQTLRPNENMIRPVCTQCHGLGFSIDALADPALVERNFQGQPRHHVRSMDMAVARVKAERVRRAGSAR